MRDPAELHVPKLEIGDKELKMALSLVETIKGEWQPTKYHDEYREGLMKVIEEKVKTGGKVIGLKPMQPVTSKKVIDLVQLLQASLASTKQGKTEKAAAHSTRTKVHKRAA